MQLSSQVNRSSDRPQSWRSFSRSSVSCSDSSLRMASAPVAYKSERVPSAEVFSSEGTGQKLETSFRFPEYGADPMLRERRTAVRRPPPPGMSRVPTVSSLTSRPEVRPRKGSCYETRREPTGCSEPLYRVAL